MSPLDHHYCEIVRARMPAAETASVFKTRARQRSRLKRGTVAHQLAHGLATGQSTTS